MHITRREFLIGAGALIVILVSVLLLYSFDVPGAKAPTIDADEVPAM